MNVDEGALLFAGMAKLSPGDNAETVRVLHLLPKREFNLVVDAGCGTGRQTLALAYELRTKIHAVDVHQMFLHQLTQRAHETKLEQLIETHCMDMKDIPAAFPRIDLLWSEGAAYNIGFANALETWRRALAPDGFAVVSELSWLKKDAPSAVEKYFRTAYPDMRDIEENIEVAKSAGYKVLTTRILPSKTWIEGYYELLAPRAQALLEHSESAVRTLAAETIQEIEIFDRSGESYGYVFYVLQRHSSPRGLENESSLYKGGGLPFF
jgi:SAM-dependent methyltransferase